MGQRTKRQKFLAANPNCCFCGGGEPAETVDHVPPRICFLGRHAPEGFEFPACQRCQTATRLDELALGMFVRVNDINTNNYDSAEMRKLYAGLKNNLPHLLPSTGLTTREKRTALKAKGLSVPRGWLAADVPMVKVPAAIDAHVHRYARKLALALFYREKGYPAPPGALLYTDWTQAVDRQQMKSFLEIARMSPSVTVGLRANMPFGDRFGYRCDKADDNDLFMAVAQFGQGLVVVMLVAYGLSEEEVAEDGWVKASEMFD